MENLGAKSCGTCKHFEPSTEWRRGWCRNTLLFAPSQSHLVQSEALDCSRGAQSFWEPASPRPLVNAGQKDVKLPIFENPLNLFSPALAGASQGASGMNGGHMMFASSGSGSGSGGGGDDYDDYGYDDDYNFDDEPPAEEPAGNRPQSNRTRRSTGQANATGGRSQSASVQPEGRYWTDYLRIALPVIGIILMLGLLWVWASSILGDDSENVDNPDDNIALVETETPDPNAVNPNLVNESTPDANQPSTGEIPISGQSTPASNDAPFNPTDLSSTGTNTEAGETQTTEEEQPTAPPETETEGGGGEIAVDATVRITEDNVNVREATTIEGEPIRTAMAGEEAVVVSGPEEAEGFVWWQVVFDGGEGGYVVEDYLEVVPAE